jgi:hypothetical protein
VRKLRNFWRDGIPVEEGEPQADMVVLRAITPAECEGTIILGENASSHTIYEVVSVGPRVERYRAGELVLPVFEALRAAGDHLLCREDEITMRWERSALEVDAA